MWLLALTWCDCLKNTAVAHRIVWMERSAPRAAPPLPMQRLTSLNAERWLRQACLTLPRQQRKTALSYAGHITSCMRELMDYV